jgi:hypothetical protein
MASEQEKADAAARLRARAAEWSTTDCEEICSHEVGDTIADFLLVLGLDKRASG